jgi:hypothetical protein
MSFKKQDIYGALESISAPGEGKNLVESIRLPTLLSLVMK